MVQNSITMISELQNCTKQFTRDQICSSNRIEFALWLRLRMLQLDVGRTFFIEKSALSFVIFYLLLIKVKLNKLTIG